MKVRSTLAATSSVVQELKNEVNWYWPSGSPETVSFKGPWASTVVIPAPTILSPKDETGVVYTSSNTPPVIEPTGPSAAKPCEISSYFRPSASKVDKEAPSSTIQVVKSRSGRTGTLPGCRLIDDTISGYGGGDCAEPPQANRRASVKEY